MDGRIPKQEAEKLLRAETVNCLVAVSKAFAATPSHRVMKHWDRLRSELSVSLTGVSNVGQWQEVLLGRLQITALPSYLCSAFEALESSIERVGYDFFGWLYFVRPEVRWFVTHIRLESEKRAESHAERLVDHEET